MVAMKAASDNAANVISGDDGYNKTRQVLLPKSCRNHLGRRCRF